MIWQMMTAKLHSNGQLRTEKDGDTEKGCQTSAVRLLMMMISPLCVGYNYHSTTIRRRTTTVERPSNGNGIVVVTIALLGNIGLAWLACGVSATC